MNLSDNSIYKFERKFRSKDTYQVKVTTELLEDLESFPATNEVVINIDEKTGTLTIPLKNNLSKVFNLNIEPITRGEMESLEMNVFRPNKTVESLGDLNVRLNVQATSKVYDMTKKKIVEIEDENKKHCAKELKLPCSNKSSLSYKVFQNKETRKSEANSFDQKKIVSSTFSNKINQNELKKAPQFTIREKVMHLLVLKPMSKDGLLLALRELDVTSSHRAEVEKHLQQVAKLNKDNMYQLSNQFIFEIRDDWPQFNNESKKRIAKIKSEVKSKLPGDLNNSSLSNQIFICKDRNNVKKEQQSSNSSQSKIPDINILSFGKSATNNKSRDINLIDKSLNSRKTLEPTNREPNNKKATVMSPKSDRSRRQDTISPAESNSSSKTINSNDEGFVSGDKKSPIKFQSNFNSNKRYSQNLLNNCSDVSAPKISHLSDKNTLSRHDLNSNSSCDVTPTSDVSQTSNTFCSNDSKSDFKSSNNTISDNHCRIKMNDSDNDGTQARFNIAFEEYSKLCAKLKEREEEVEKLRASCKNIKSSDYTKMYKIAKSLLDKMETPQFQAIIERVKTLESEMCTYVHILTGQQLN